MTYDRFVKAIRGERLPCALVDVEALDENVDRLLGPIRQRNKTLRLATKSVRSLSLIRRIIERAGAAARGVMSFSVAEAAFLASEGLDDIFVAYPTGQQADAAELARLSSAGHNVSIAVDCTEHFELLGHAASAHAPIRVVVEADMSYRPAGRVVHVGVRRSPLFGADAVLRFAEEVERHPGVQLYGVMGYEAQIAGVPDANPFAPLLNAPKRALKRLSRGIVEQTRQRIADGLKTRGIRYEIFNGGGSGSLAWCTQETALTEVTAGSGFLDSHLFDYYRDLDVRPAAFFALQVVRQPAEGMVTCHGGGYVASGEAGEDRLPVPFLPPGLHLTKLEGAGEVQTPLHLRGAAFLRLGAPVFFRHAKAGELAEHFNEYLWIAGDRIVDRASTYRGAGHQFL